MKKTMTMHEIAELVRKIGIVANDVLGIDYEYRNSEDHYILMVNGKRVRLSASTEKDMLQIIFAIRISNFGIGEQKVQQTDEEAGLSQASQNGENPFEHTMLSM